MDLSVRDWMIIIGVLLAVAVLLDGFRRMRKERGDTIRLAAKRRREAEDELVNPELPGSARVVAVREEPSLHVKRAPSPSPQDDEPDEQPVSARRSGPASPAPQAGKPSDDDILFQDPEIEYGRRPRDEVSPPKTPDTGAGKSATRAPSRTFSADRDDDADGDVSLSASAEDRVGDVSPSPAPAAPAGQKRSADKTPRRDDDGPQELIVLNVMAPDGKPYSGPDVLQVLLACDVRFGRMNIFHRHEKPDGTGAEQFSVANLVEPGYFDLDAMDDFSTPGLLFFMNLPGPEDSVKAFDAMVETARCLVKNLGGELRDQTHSVATKQTLEHYKQRIRDFERRQLTLM